MRIFGKKFLWRLILLLFVVFFIKLPNLSTKFPGTQHHFSDWQECHFTLTAKVICISSYLPESLSTLISWCAPLGARTVCVPPWPFAATVCMVEGCVTRILGLVMTPGIWCTIVAVVPPPRCNTPPETLGKLTTVAPSALLFMAEVGETTLEPVGEETMMHDEMLERCIMSVAGNMQLPLWITGINKYLAGTLALTGWTWPRARCQPVCVSKAVVEVTVLM